MRRWKRTRDKCDFVQFGAGFVFSFTLDSYWRALTLLPSHPNSLFSPTGSAPLSPRGCFCECVLCVFAGGDDDFRPSVRVSIEGRRLLCHGPTA
jgi:hypothetical protein